MRRMICLLVFLLLAGCVGSGEKSELLSLLGIDEKIVDTVDEGENIFDALTLLKRGEAHYTQEDYTSAADEFGRFLELYPLHRMAAFAKYRLGMSHYHQMNTHDRDPGPMKKATAAFEKLVTDHPQSLYVEEARENIVKLTRRQAEHEFYIGHFYYKKEAYPAAILRLEKALAKEGKGPTAEKALYYLGLSHYHAGHREEARGIFQKLLSEYPRSPYARQSEGMLAHLGVATAGS
jgi:outer membrane protein assembly factor BamD